MRISLLVVLAGLPLLLLNRCGKLGPDFVEPPDPVFAITDPSRGDTLLAGSAYSIGWLSDERSGDLVRIDLIDSAGGAEAIAGAAMNNGRYDWSLPYDKPRREGCRIAITSVPDDAFSDTSGYFTIDNYNDGYEVDSSVSLATVIDTGAAPQLHTLPRGDVDWFRFEAVSGTSYCVEAGGAPFLWIGIYGPRLLDTLALLAGSGNPGQEIGAQVIWTCALGGTCYFSILGNSIVANESYSVQLKAGGAICKMLSPVQGSRFSGGSPTVITWTHSSNSGALVSLYLYRDDTLTRTIVSRTANDDSCRWTIPFTVPSSPRYRVKIVSDNDPSVNDFSGYFSIENVPCAITITAPAGSSSWNSGDFCTIKWAYTGEPGLYASLALYDSTAFIATLASGVEIPDGEYTWHISGGLPTSPAYRCKLISMTDTAVWALSQPFTVTNIPSSLTIISPRADSNWIAGTGHSVRWTYAGDPGAYVRLELFESDTAAGSIAAVANLTDGSYTWNVPLSLPASSRYRVKITSITDTAITDFSDQFTITYIAPAIAVTQPGTGTTLDAGSPCTVTWTNFGPVGGKVSIGLYEDSTPVTTLVSATENTGSYRDTLFSGLAGGSRYRIKVASTSLPSVSAFSGYFAINPMPVRLQVTSPDMNPSWNTGSTYAVQWTASGPVGATVRIELFDSSSLVRTISANEYAFDEGHLWFVPFSLPSGGRYRIKITNTVVDTVFDWSDYFTIVNVPATITVTSPLAGVAWKAGTTNAITWTSSNVPGTSVAIALYDNTSTIVTVVASNVSRAGGSYAWTLPVTLSGGAGYLIKISSVTDSSVHAFSGKFTILPQPNSLTVTKPLSTASWTGGQYYTIYWSSTGSPGTAIAIDLYDSSALVRTISPKVYTANEGFLWLVPSTLQPGSRYRIKITSTTLDSVFDFSDTFSITSAVTGDNYEPDSVPALATAIARDAAAQSHALTVGDRDWFSFTAAAGTTYTIETRGSTDTYLDLFSTNGITPIASDDDHGSELLNARIVWTPAASGVYFFMVKGSMGAVGEYMVTVR